ARPLARFIPRHDNDPNPDRRLRIGYVSPHLSSHVVGLYFLPLIANHDHTRFEIFCYSDLPRPDAMTERIKSHADHWRTTCGTSDEQFCDLVRRDRIDLLIDLTMHMDENRMLAFARKPAPVQATWLGYPGSTGLETMDYRISDPYLDPPETDESLYSEKTIRLPHCYWWYDPPSDAPAVGSLPAERNRFVTFGNLGNFTKVNPKILDLWAAVLRALPSSRLLMLAPTGAARDRMIGQLESKGIERARLEFTERIGRLAYLNLYNRIDIGLDSFPYNGHTTSLDSLWMGVPVVTLAGQTAVSRGGASILSNAGLTDLIANDADQYVQIARELAGDLARLAQLRCDLRTRMQRSPLTDAARSARHMEAAYRLMWRNWCDAQAALDAG
ncbi:MAG TPA: hypothetical protein VN541_17525, partial [Tepidisphaeraceae bacterium]|nr:hypothetical protein [Tepidisphaeraceae bacterium]